MENAAKKEYVTIEIERGTDEVIAAAIHRLFSGLAYAFMDDVGRFVEGKEGKWTAHDWLLEHYEAIGGAVMCARELSAILYDYLTAVNE